MEKGRILFINEEFGGVFCFLLIGKMFKIINKVSEIF